MATSDSKIIGSVLAVMLDPTFRSYMVTRSVGWGVLRNRGGRRPALAAPKIHEYIVPWHRASRRCQTGTLAGRV